MCIHLISKEDKYFNYVLTYNFKENLSQIFSYFTSFTQLNNLHDKNIFTYLTSSKQNNFLNLDIITSFELLIKNDIITLELIEKKNSLNYNLLEYKIIKINENSVLNIFNIFFSFYMNTNDNSTVVVLEILGYKYYENLKKIGNNIKKYFSEEFKKLSIFLYNNNLNIINYESILINRPLLQVIKYLNKCKILNNCKYYKLIKIDGNKEKISIFLKNEISSMEINIIYLSNISSFVEVKRNFNIYLSGNDFINNKNADAYLLMRLKDKLEKEILY
jgi:hypothetical protein